MLDALGVVGTVIVAIIAIPTVIFGYLGIRSTLRRDKRDQAEQEAKALQVTIDKAIEADNARRELQAARDEIKRLKGTP